MSKKEVVAAAGGNGENPPQRTVRIDRNAEVLKIVQGVLSGKHKKRMMVSVESLMKDCTYQRPTSEAKVKRMAENWCPDMCLDILVSRRKTKNGTEDKVMDGWHRVEAASRVGIKKLWAIVYEGFTSQEEAALFWAFNTQTDSPSALQKYHASIRAKVPSSLAIKETLDRFNMYVPMNGSCGGNAVNCVGVLTDIISKLNGREVLEMICDAISRAWDEKEPERLSKDIFEGLRFLIESPKHKDAIDWDRMISCLSQRPPQGFKRTAEETRRNIKGCSIGKSMAAAFAYSYNDRLSDAKRLNVLADNE